jgi:hypothetical protein
MKILREYQEKENPLAEKIHAMEEYLRVNNICIDSPHHLYLTVNNRKFRIVGGFSFPRLTEEEKLEVIE